MAIVIATLLAAAALPQPTVPSANPDDQIRFFWGIHGAMYPELRDSGFNNIVNPFFAPFQYDIEKGCGYEGPISDCAQMAADGVDRTFQILPCRLPYLKRKYARINRDGSRYEKVVDVTTPGCLGEIRKLVDYYARRAKELKCVVGVMPESEERMATRPNFAPHAREAFRKATGLDVPPEADGRAAPHWSKLKDIPADRVIDKDHPVLAYYRWFWKEGDGFETYYKVAIDAFERELGYRPFSLYDPCNRVPPLWGSGGEVSHIEQWQVADPIPYQVGFTISEMNAMAKGRPGQKTLMLVQGICDSRDVAPTNDLPANVPAWRTKYPTAMYVTPAPDMLLESLWTTWSRQVDGFGFHGWDALWVDAETLKMWRPYYVHTNPETKKVIKRAFRDVALPLGPLFRAAPEPSPEVAVLEGYASAILSGDAPWDWCRPYRIYGYLAEAANLQPSVLFEEEIARDGIPDSVKVILAPKCDVVTKETFAALKAFQRRGGKIVADDALVPALKADAQLPKQPGYYLYRTDGARHDADWKAAAAALEKTVRAFVPATLVREDDEIILRMRRCAGADYVFAINDRRGYGDYFGPWKRVREKGLPHETAVSVRRRAGAVYDLVRHEAVAFTVRDGFTRIPVSYTTSDGRVLLVADRPLGKLKIDVAKTAEGLSVAVTSPDRGVMLPIGVKVGTRKPYFGVTRDGRWSHVFRDASDESVRVVDLATGIRY